VKVQRFVQDAMQNRGLSDLPDAEERLDVSLPKPTREVGDVCATEELMGTPHRPS
jgi:hypothetical protein